MSQRPVSDAGGPTEDPLVRSSRREAILVLVIWAAALGFSVWYCKTFGYDSTRELTFVLGIPKWVFVGVLIPWLVCTAAGVLFANVFMRDDPLGSEREIESDAIAEELDHA